MVATLLAALVLDVVVGWPDRLFRRIGHPVVWIGALIDRLDRRWNVPAATDRQRRLMGVATVCVVVGTAAAAGAVIQAALPDGWLGVVIGAVLAWPLIAMRSLHDHVARVAVPLEAGDLARARLAVSAIVGRDPAVLDEAGIARAAIESLAENTSDGVVAPLFWAVVAGLPGLYGYKAINTLDSMIGHRTPRHEAFGWAAARLDDGVNLVPARLNGLLFALAGGRPARAIAVMIRDARRHRSPNAGWPEAAMAGSLGIRLSGPRVYGDRRADEPWLNGAAPDPVATDIRRALRLYSVAMAVVAAGLLGGALL